MNNLKAKMSVRFGIVSLLFLAAAISLLIFQHNISEQSKQQLAQMQAQGQANVSAGDLAGADLTADVSDGNFIDDTVSGGDIEPLPPIELTDNPYQESFLANPDMGAWLKVEGTVIDYPVMWTPRDEVYYLNRNFDGKEDKNGCLLLDTDSCTNPLTTNLIIHGHNMKSGAMFGSLMKYEDEEYCKEHKSITLYTPDCERRYEVVAVFRSQVYKKKDEVFKFYKFFQADTEEEFEDFYQNIKELSLYDTGVTAEFGDHFITLSTCAYHVAQGRFVVVGKEVEIGDHYKPIEYTQENTN